MRVERTHSERFEAGISSRVIPDQEIKEANSSSQSSLLSPLRPWLDGDRLATCFAYVGDPREPRLWALPYRLEDGAIDAKAYRRQSRQSSVITVVPV